MVTPPKTDAPRRGAGSPPLADIKATGWLSRSRPWACSRARLPAVLVEQIADGKALPDEVVGHIADRTDSLPRGRAPARQIGQQNLSRPDIPCRLTTSH